MVSGKYRLTVKKVENAKKWGYLSDGHGLYLKVRKSGAKSWAYIWTQKASGADGKGKRREMSLGSAAGPQALSLKRAREVADAIRDQISSGIDPIAERKKEAPKTFIEVAEMLLTKLTPTWKSNKTAEQWRRSLLIDCKPIHNLAVNSVSDADCRSIVMPVWERTPETGLRLRKRLERVLSYAEAHGMREGRNPARWEGHFKEALVGSDKIARKNFPSMPYVEVPAFIKKLHEIDSLPAMALEFTILTGARSNETLGAVWSEIDLEAALWSIPGDRMKNGHPHEVPLTDRTIEILTALHEMRVSDYVFPGQRPKRPLSNMCMTMLMRRSGFGEFVPHGFRSSFRTWCGDMTNVSREVAEAALSHRVGSAVELAYSRGDALEKRRRLMPLWSDFCAGKQSGEIVMLHG